MKEEKFNKAIDALSLYGLQKYLTTDDLMNLSSSTSNLRTRFRKYFFERIDPDNRKEVGGGWVWVDPPNKWIRNEETIESYLKECQGVSREFCKYLVRPFVKITENTSPESIRKLLETLGENLSWIHLDMRNKGSSGSPVCEAPITLDFRDVTVIPERQKPCILQFIQEYNPNLRVLHLDIDFKASDIITNQYPTLPSVREFSISLESSNEDPEPEMRDWSKTLINHLLQAFPNLEKIDLSRQEDIVRYWEPVIEVMNYILENKDELCPKLQTIEGFIYPESEEYLSLLQKNAHLFQHLSMDSSWNSRFVNEYEKFIKTIAENGRCESIELTFCENFTISPDMRVATVKTLCLEYYVQWAHEADMNFLYAFHSLVKLDLRSGEDVKLPLIPANLPFVYTLKTLSLTPNSGLSQFLSELKVLKKLTLNYWYSSSSIQSDYEITNETTTLWNTLEELNLSGQFVCNGNNHFLKNFKNLKILDFCGHFEADYKYPLDCQFKDTLEEFSVALQSKENKRPNLSLFIDQFNKLSKLSLSFRVLGDNPFQLQFSPSVSFPIKHVTLFNCPDAFDLRFLHRLNLVETIIFDDTNLINSKDFSLPGPASKANYAKSIRKFFDPLLNLRAVYNYMYYSSSGNNFSNYNKLFVQALQDYFMSRGIKYFWKHPEEGVIF